MPHCLYLTAAAFESLLHKCNILLLAVLHRGLIKIGLGITLSGMFINFPLDLEIIFLSKSYAVRVRQFHYR